MIIFHRPKIPLLFLVLALWAAAGYPAAAEPPGSSGTLAVVTEPRSANVYVDGRFYGMTPVEFPLTPGEHRLRILKEGFMIVEQPVLIETGGRAEISATLEPAALLVAKSIPGGADVLVDGEKVGTTPAEVPVRPGVRLVEVTKEGHEPWANKMWFDAGEKRWVNAELPYKFGRLEVYTIPGGATVFIDDEDRGSADPLVIEYMPPGRYRVRLSLATYEDRLKDIMVERGETLSVLERLEHTLAFREQERERREARNSVIRKTVRITSLSVGLVAAVYAGKLQSGVRDREQQYQNTAYAEEALKYRQEVRDWEEKRNIWAGVATLTLSAGLMTFVF